ncbi:dehydrodolichyl diphosphate synthase complex subunit NUS1 [Drosophila rhopaloa]|uniref:ditrans,polycis-polyprenyl diphosphate synthase [(2E,6E)-farnesyldiphosphate specific] n=1 Tax=Drosophila rhopaloa TaxID=1041015 RepID=A0ABM5JB20_DRORH|nr:dehydrodolichyl diphosphate synthase complex subunit NUS1 [Drosophila rhopaloa]XP_016972062.2 dehydrodolichyl diphosphate synthase complex subunit NUS1 [Drosophila rhopaloa]XP_044316019.1 dehydrodolichyl diphosphate synthase complex subunit NUS1 [Drosophila rhopaloa]
MIEVLCLLLGRILLLLIGGYELIWRLRERLNALVVRLSYDLWRSAAARELHERRVLTDCRSQLTKTPQHLVLVISPTDAGVDAVLLRRIFDFALDVGIKHVSLYDRRTKDKGYVDLADICRSSSEEQGGSFKWPPTSSPSKAENPPKNGEKTNGYVNGANGSHSTQLQLYQISAADGHALIADVCRELYEGRETPVVQNLLKQKREALTEQISDMLNKRLGFVAPEPELGIVFARQTCTYGLLPWHVRFTEFHTHPSGRHFNVETFANILSKYSRCEQRWGT